MKKPLTWLYDHAVVFYFLLFTFYFTTTAHAQIDNSTQRQVHLQGAVNFRDLGGYTTKDGRQVKWGKLYRSAALNNLIPADIDTLQNRHIAYDLDFRGPYEVAAAPDKIPAAIRRISLPAGSETIGDSNSMKSMYRNALSDSFMLNFYGNLAPFHDRYKPLFDELLQLPQDSALLFHCTAGKDRTGIAAALVLYALGVNEPTIEKDYLATNYYRQAENQKGTNSLTRYGITEAQAKRMMAADPTYLQATFAAIKKQYSSVENYLEKEMGLNKKELKKLRMMYLN